MSDTTADARRDSNHHQSDGQAEPAAGAGKSCK